MHDLNVGGHRVVASEREVTPSAYRLGLHVGRPRRTTPLALDARAGVSEYRC